MVSVNRGFWLSFMTCSVLCANENVINISFNTVSYVLYLFIKKNDVLTKYRDNWPFLRRSELLKQLIGASNAFFQFWMESELLIYFSYFVCIIFGYFMFFVVCVCFQCLVLSLDYIILITARITLVPLITLWLPLEFWFLWILFTQQDWTYPFINGNL